MINDKELQLYGSDCPGIGHYPILARRETYATAMIELQNTMDHCMADQYKVDGLARPLTIAEVMRAQVDNFETHTDVRGNNRSVEERLRWFETEIDTCSAILYDVNSPALKIRQCSHELISISPDVEGDYLSCDFANAKGTLLSRFGLTFPDTVRQGIDSAFWRCLVSEDKHLLHSYLSIIFSFCDGYISKSTNFPIVKEESKFPLRYVPRTIIKEHKLQEETQFMVRINDQ